MRFTKVALKLNAKQFSKLVELGERVHASMTGNGNYVTPSPSLLALRAGLDALTLAIGAWGPVGARGSNADYVDLCAKAQDVWELLKAMSEYVQNTAMIAAGSNYVTLKSILISSGFDLGKTPVPQGVLESVRDFRNFKQNSLNRNQVKLKWKRPLNTSRPGDVSIYELYRSNTTSFSDAELITSVTRTEFIDTNTTASPVDWYYWVVPFNTAGAGAVSEVVAVTVLGAL